MLDIWCVCAVLLVSPGVETLRLRQIVHEAPDALAECISNALAKLPPLSRGLVAKL
jgi:hypothetical protein